MRNIFKRLIIIAYAALLLGFAGCSGGSNEEAQGSGPKLRVGMELGFPPFEMKDEKGKAAGVSVDLAKALAESMNRNAEIVDMPFNTLIPALQGGKIDVLISSMTITPEREEIIDFSDPYLTTGLCILAGGRTLVYSINDVDKPDVRVVVKKGTTGEKWAQSNIAQATVIAKDKEEVCLKLVIDGQADCFVYDQISTFKNWRKHQISTRALLIPFKEEHWAVGIRKGNDELRLRINGFLKKFRERGGFEMLGDKHLKEQKEAFQRLGFPFYL